MSIEQLKNKLSEHAKDIKLNLSSVLTEEGAQGLTQKQIYGIALACAYTTQNPVVIEAILADSRSHLTENELNAAKSAAIIMGMNNVYYRFLHLVSDKSYTSMPAKLRMNVIGNPGISKVDFELYCLAVSAINGCGMCLEAHEREIVGKGLSREAVQDAVRIASVVHAVAVTLESEGVAMAVPVTAAA